MRQVLHIAPHRPALLLAWRHLCRAFLASLVLAGCGSTEPPIPPVPNVILISLDTLRADHLGVYGYERPTSPEIDAFAGESFVFERALAPAPNTPPSQMTMMTSLTPGRHGFTGSWDTLAPDIETLAQRLSQAGLATAGFVDAGYLRAIFGFDRGFDTYDDRGGGLAAIVPRALRWLDDHPDQRFFLFVHTYDIHAPYVSPAPYAGMFHETPYRGSLDPTAEALDAIWRESIEISAADLQHLVDSYDEGIRYTDAQLGEFLTALRERGRLDDTLIIITSDHGEEFGEHGSVSHWRLYFQPNLRIPLIIRLPGGDKGPERLTQPTQLLDVLPTILDAAGAPRLDAAQGRSLMPLITARTAGPEHPTDAVRAILGWWPEPLTQPRRSIILGDSQLIFDSATPGKEELYDLAADPMTRNNLAADRPDEVARLLARARADLARNQPLPGTGKATQIELEHRVLEQLEALGYRPVRTEAGAPASTPE